MKRTFFMLLLLAACSDDKSIGSTRIMRGGTNDLLMMNQADNVCPQDAETPCQVLFIKKEAIAPTSIPLTDAQVDDVLMYFAVDNNLEYDTVRLKWNCKVFRSFDIPGTKYPTCITPEMLNKLLAPYHAK